MGQQVAVLREGNLFVGCEQGPQIGLGDRLHAAWEPHALGRSITS
jgi:hypothetical protein